MFEGDIRLAYPEIKEHQTGDTFPCPPDYALVEILPMPEFDLNIYTTNILPPIQVNGAWEARWAPVRPYTEEELIFNAKVLARDIALKNTSQIYKNLDAAGEAPNVIG